MARPLRIQFPGACYHVTCRGNERRPVFIDDHDRREFLEFLKTSLATYQVTLHAYIQMTNHFHLLVQTARGNLSEFMRHLGICYTGWFNARHRRPGHLFQGRYKAYLVDADAYLLEVSRYIHLNLARVRRWAAASYPERHQQVSAYRWSSLPGYLERSRAVDFVDYDLTLSLANGRAGYRDFVFDGLAHEIRNPFKAAQRGLILGDADFVARLKREKRLVGSRREQPAYRHLTKPQVSPERVLDLVADGLGIEREALLARNGDGVARGIASELLYRYSGLNQTAIGKLLGGIDYSGVSRLRSRLRQKMTQDRPAREQYERLDVELARQLSNVKI